MPDLIRICDDETYKIVRTLILEKAMRCAECGGSQSSLFVMSDCSVAKARFLVRCNECKHEGAFARNIPDCVEKWNNPASLYELIFEHKLLIRVVAASILFCIVTFYAMHLGIAPAHAAIIAMS